MSEESLDKIKKLIANESPEVLRALVLSMAQDNDRMKSALKKYEDEKLQASQSKLNIEEQIKLFKRKIFGRSKEDREAKSESGSDRKTEEESRLFAQAAFPLPDDTQKTQKEKWVGLAVTELFHEMSKAELQSESVARGIENPSSDQWRELPGVFDKITTIQIIERSYEKQVHNKKKYRLDDEFNPDKDEKDVIVTAAGPASLLPGMNYTTEFVASVVSDKYVLHMPLARQATEMNSLGLPGIRTSTLSRFCALSAASFEEMCERIKAELLEEAKRIALHLDETPWRIQNKEQKDGYMWVISSRLGSYYFYKPTRSGEVMREMLEGYTGRVLTDAYAGYNILDEIGIEQGFCWSHARRGFIPLEQDDPGAKAILDDIGDLFRIEREAKSFEELKNLRDEKSRPVVERLRLKLIEEYPKSRPKSLKRKAIEYLMKLWKGFTLFLDDIRLPLSNNEAERTIRHAVVGRKNYHGSNNHTGAETAATHFTIIETCKKNEIDPRQFILMTLKRIAAGKTVWTPLEYAKHLRMPAETPAV